MEWVETTARTLDEAKEAALDQLGVGSDDAEFEVLDEPKAGLFGRMRGEARVRARVRPTQPRPKLERRDRKKRTDTKAADGTATPASPSTGDSEPASAESGEVPAAGQRRPRRAPAASGGRETVRSERVPAERTSAERVDRVTKDKETIVDAAEVGVEAKRFVEGLVGAFGLTGVVDLRQDEDDLEVTVEGADLGLLVGPRGATLQAIQELTRVASQRRLGDHDTRLRVDVGGYRVRRREALGRFAMQVADEVVSSGSARSLEPMSSSDRKIVHDALSDVEGVDTSSEGDDPNRRVVISPANG